MKVAANLKELAEEFGQEAVVLNLPPPAKRHCTSLDLNLVWLSAVP